MTCVVYARDAGFNTGYKLMSNVYPNYISVDSAFDNAKDKIDHFLFFLSPNDTMDETCNGPLTRYVKLRIAHAPGMPGTVSLPPQVSDPDMHHVMHAGIVN